MKFDAAETTLHILNKPQSTFTLNQQLSQCIQEGDAVLLIEDGVYQCQLLATEPEPKAFRHLEQAGSVHWSITAARIYVLGPDAQARGLEAHVNNQANLSVVDYPAFVALTLAHKKVISWY